MTNRPPDKMSTAAAALEQVFMDTGKEENPVYIGSDDGSVYESTHGGSQDSATPRASRCPSPAAETNKKVATENSANSGKEGGNSVDQKYESAGESADDEEMSEAESQYETEEEDQCILAIRMKNSPIRERSFPPLSNKDPIEGLVGMQGDAIRKAMRANKVLKSGNRAIATPLRSHTRGQNDTATKQSVRELTDEVRDLKGIMTKFFAAMGQREETEEHRWVGLHEAWLNAKDMWSDTLAHMVAMRDIEWIDEGKSDEKGNAVEKEGPDWFDRTDRTIRSLRQREEKKYHAIGKDY